MGNSFLGRTIVNGARQQALQERLMGAMAPRQSHRAHGALLQERGTTGKASARTLRVSGRTVSAAGNRRWINDLQLARILRSEEGRVGKGVVRTGSIRRAPEHYKK